MKCYLLNLMTHQYLYNHDGERKKGYSGLFSLFVGCVNIDESLN
jgi:hypothetical protein